MPTPISLILFWAFVAALCTLTAWLLSGRSYHNGWNLPPEAVSEAPKSPETAHLFLRPIDINHVSMEGLKVLPGIGRTRAEKMLQYRENRGPFLHKDELLNLDNPIPPGLINSLWPYITVN